MAYQGSILSAMSVTLMMLLNLTLSVCEAVVCPSYPEDPTWKNSMSADELQLHKISKRYDLRWSGTFKQGAKVLIHKQDTVDQNATQAVKMAVTRARPSNSRGVFDVGMVLTLGFRPPYDEGMVNGGGGGGGGGASQEVKIAANGNFDEATGELCALACISDICDYKLSVKYPKPKTIRENFIEGNLTSLRGVTEKTYFDRITIHSVGDVPFEYTMNATLASVCPTLAPDVVEGKLWSKDEDADLDCLPGLRGVLYEPIQVHWNPECEGTNCSPFAELGGSAAGTTFLRVGSVSCHGDQLQVSLLFSNAQHFYPPQLTDPSTSDRTLLAEGVWDNETKQLCMIACHHLYGKRDCEIAITSQFPLTLTATQRSAVVGHIQSLRKEADPAYFKPITFKSVAEGYTQGIAQDDFGDAIQSMKQFEYLYTKVEAAKAECAKLTEENPKKRGTYPSGENSQNMEFMVLKDPPSSAGTQMSFQPAHFLSIFTRGQEFIDRMFDQLQHHGTNVTGVGVTGSTVQTLSQDGITNVSYTMHYDIGPAKQQRDDVPFPGLSLSRIAGEGIYDSNTGKLCLIGCRALEHEMDCETFFAIQLPPRDSLSDTLKGTLKSLRRPTDALYFKPEAFSGLKQHVANSLWRVNLEIVLSILMLSLTVVFLLHQVRHSKRHPETLPFISMSTLLLLSLAHMLPLLIDFDALFQPDTIYESVIRREVDKVVIRMITMAAMLLQLRLLQLVWKSRTEAARVTVQERQLLYYILPLYLAGGVIAMLVLEFKYYVIGIGKGKAVVWRDVQAFGGLVLDLHLLPQVVANVVWDAREQSALSKPFYVGMAMVRSAPHVYDLCRRFSIVHLMSDVYVYADPEWDLYSVGADVVVPCLVMVLAFVVFLQQRWGGRCVLPRPWRTLLEQLQYEKVDRLPTDCSL